MDSTENNAHTRTGGSMMTLTPTDKFSTEQIFKSSGLSATYGIGVLMVIVNRYPVEGLYINDQTLDVSINSSSSKLLFYVTFRHQWSFK